MKMNIKGMTVILALAVLCLSGCSNIFTFVKENTGSSESITSSGACAISATFTNLALASASSQSRSAFPVNDTTSTSYLVFRMSISDTSYSLVEPETDTYNFTFEPSKIDAGTHTVTFYGIPYSSDITVANAVVSGSQSVTFTSGKKSYSLSMPLETVAECTETGSLSLSFSEANSAVTKVTAKLMNGTETKYKDTGNLTNGISITGISGGVYTLLVLYEASDGSILSTSTDTVTIWPLLTTTDQITTGSSYTTFYVRGGTSVTNDFYSTYGSQISGLVAASNSNTGGIADPFADLQPAVDSLIASGLSGTIYVDGTVTYSSTGSNGTNAMVDMTSSATQTITIKSMSSENAVIDGGSKMRVMYVSGDSLTVSLNAITIQNGCSSANGGGISKSGAGTLAITGCTISSNTATTIGGGLYVSAGTVTLTDSTVGAAVTTTNGTQDSSVAATSDSHSNYASEKGGGIYLAGGEVDLKGSSAVAYNYAANGGGVYVSGGTLNVGSSSTDAAAEVYANGTGDTGGGIFNNGGTANIYGTIHHNKGQNASGIYVGNTTTLNGSATIRDNYTAATENSSGCVVVEGPSAAFTMNDSSVLSNNGCIINKTYNQYEGYVASGTFTMSGSAVVKATANVYNSVYLTGGKYITVSDTLTPALNTAAGSPSLSAMIMPSSYTSNDSSSTVQVLKASASTTLTAAIPHFDVVRAGGCITASTTDATKGVLNCVARVGDTPTYYYSLGLAVDAVSSGGTVTLCKSFTMNSMLTVNKNFTLATGSSYTITRSSALTASPLFTVSSGNTLTLNTSGAANTLTLDGGTGSSIEATAPLIVNSGTLNVNKCTLQNNKNDYENSTGTAPDSTGGAVYSTGTLNLNTGSTISGCRAYYGGAVYSAGGTFTMTDGTIGDSTKTTAPTDTVYSNASNSANETGGAVYASAGTVDLKGGTICYNSACYNGALSIVSGVSFTLEGTSVAYNTAQDSGGGIALYCAAPSITGGSVYGNKVTNTSGTSGNGGGVYYSCSGGTLTMSGGIVGGADASKANTAANGGGVYVASGTMTLNGGTVGYSDANAVATSSAYGNEATSCGGGIYVASTGSMALSGSGVKVAYNYSSGNGGGVYLCNGCTMSAGTIYGNTANNGGGAYLAGGTFTMSGGRIGGATASEANTAGGSGNNLSCGGGGAYINAGTMELTGGTIGYVADTQKTASTTDFANKTASRGGGIYVNAGATLTMTSGHVDYNYAAYSTDNNYYTYLGGGGIFSNGGTVNISGNSATASTVSYNYATTGGGGIALYTNSCFNLYRGTVAYNTAAGTNAGGGGIYVYCIKQFQLGANGSITTADIPCFTELLIHDNRAYNGGGVFVHLNMNTDSNTGYYSRFDNGYIYANNATNDGGGMYFESDGKYPGTFYFYRFSITRNTATEKGGGIANYLISPATINLEINYLEGDDYIWDGTTSEYTNTATNNPSTNQIYTENSGTANGTW